MKSIGSLIKFENEHSALDFKAIQYAGRMHEDLLKDVLAMANADVDGDRFIVLGVKHFPNGERELKGIRESDFIDPAIYQQLVSENIEPAIELDYFSHEVDEKLFGIIRIGGCDRQPFMMKKDFGSLRAGDAFVREGSHQRRLRRQDLDRIEERKGKADVYGEQLDVSFADDNRARSLVLGCVSTDGLPSAIAAMRIDRELKRRANPKETDKTTSGSELLRRLAEAMTIGDYGLATKSEDDLRSTLDRVPADYLEDDLYELFEVRGSRVNAFVYNDGTEYIQDVDIEMSIPRVEGLLVATQIHREPIRGMARTAESILGPLSAAQYPLVELREETYHVREHIGAVKHHRVTRVFDESLRVVANPSLAGTSIQIQVFLFAENLKQPVLVPMTISFDVQESSEAA